MALLIGAFAVTSAAEARAGELGHFSPVLADIRDYAMPAKPGFAVKLYTYYYTSDTFRNFNGDKVSTIPLPGGGTATLDVDVGTWTFTLQTETSYDWEGEQWSVPVNALVSKLLKIEGQAVSLGAGVRYWAGARTPARKASAPASS